MPSLAISKTCIPESKYTFVLYTALAFVMGAYQLLYTRPNYDNPQCLEYVNPMILSEVNTHTMSSHQELGEEVQRQDLSCVCIAGD